MADDSSARSSILDAATRMFCERGYAATSMRALAEAASTSQALIHHHFGTKQGLYGAVRDSLVSRLEAAEVLRPVDPVPDGDPIAPLARALERYGAFLEDNPEFLRMASWARLEGDLRPWTDLSHLLAPMAERIRAAQCSGLLRADLDVPMHLTMIGGIVEHWVAHRQAICSSFFPEDDLGSLTRRYFRQAASVLARGAHAPPESP